ncbi:outer membrane lipoprotein carrier protein LolA [Veronia nyctiphanis]|uniref:Outer-membrane lipoprotein carrier protein n=1 Tax=Veronia nyctiphanis TaxID=1278244 RepID=A0A4Q0YWF5_9GAMM|nr:outer membrane lipoprotein chaperone LolA [Veronia nyctiphanis]RXJ73529.1 outer membrane lipoprotein carrier protein LolA [Veronia nyctiphanis]
MKKYLLALILLMPLTVNASSPKQELSDRLAKVNAFSANFSQTVTSPDGELLNEGKGKLAVQRPNLFNYTPDSEDENLMVSDGETLWIYDPFVEQTTAMWLKDGTDHTPFVLLTRNDKSDWENYLVNQQGNIFTLTPKNAAVQNKLILNVMSNGEVKGFTVVEDNGPTIDYTLLAFKPKAPAATMFTFTPPEGAEIDDQRQ